MTITTTETSVEYTADGVTTDFAVPFKFLADGDLVVTVISDDGSSVEKSLTNDYTVSGAGNAGGGTVSFNSAPANGKTVRIDRWMNLTQKTDYRDGDAFPAETHEKALDRITMMVQQLAGRTGGASFDIGLKDAMHLSDSDTDAWDAENHRILNLEGPAADDEAATKEYVDDAVSTAQSSLQSIDGVRNDGGNVDLVAGSGVSITPDDGANEITIASNQDAVSLRGESLASGVGTPSDKDVLRYNNGNSEWELKSSDDALWNASQFRGNALASAASSPSDGQILEYNSTSGEWELGSKSGSAVTGIKTVDGVQNDGGDVDFIESGGITITPDDAANTVEFHADAKSVGAIASVDGVSNDGGDVDLVAGTGISISPDDGNDQVTIDADKDSKIWNADRIQGRSVQDAAPSDSDVLQWSNSNSRWEPTALSDSGTGFDEWLVYDAINDTILSQSGSITVSKDGTGQYTVSWSSAFSDSDYFVAFGPMEDNAGGVIVASAEKGGQTTTTLKVTCRNVAGTLRDPTKISIGAFE